MMHRFRVRNYKILEDIDIPLTPIHVVIGQNDSGKTSLLEAMHAYQRSSEVPLSSAFPGNWDGRELVYEGASKPVVELSADLTGHRDGVNVSLSYGFKVEFMSKGRNPRCIGEWAEVAEHREFRTLQNNYTSVGYRDNFQGAERDQLEVIGDLLGSSHLYRFDARVMSLPAAIDDRRKFRMNADGFGLPTLLDDILGFESEKFIELKK
jgi:hypothetical protein